MVVIPGSPLDEKCRADGLKCMSFDKNKFSVDFREGVQTQKWQVVHLHSTQDLRLIWPTLLKAKLKKLSLPKIILQTHILISHSKKDPMHFLQYLVVDEMWCSSEPAKKMLEKFIPIAKEKIKVIRYGRKIENTLSSFLPRSEARKQLGIASDAIAVGLVSRIDPQKGIKEFLEGAIPLIKEKRNLNLIFIGGKTKDDPKAWSYAEEIEKFYKSLPNDLAQRIHFKGELKESFRYMPALDLYALPSYKECFALSLLEAQLAGLPVIGTDSGGTPDVVIEGKTGYLFKPRDYKSAGDALQRALSSQQLWHDFGDRAKARIADEFNFEKISTQIIASYEEAKRY